MLHYKIITSPIGDLQLIASETGLRAVHSQKFFQPAISGELEEKTGNYHLIKAEKQLGEYFAGARKKFDLSLEMRGTVFQIKAWRELQKIPYATTITYGQQAARLGDSNKSRAVGAANGRNPLMIIVPCHRVIGAGGGLTGYASGVEIKEFLLELEKANS